MKYVFSNIESFEITRGFHARLIHSETMTIAYIEVEEGAILPEHAHVHEQVTNMLEGEFEFILEGERLLLRAGESVVIPSMTPHSGRALTKCKIFDVFSPVREDFRSGKVAYAIK